MSKLFENPARVLVTECGEWLLDGNVAYHRDILPAPVVLAMNDATLLRAMMKVKKNVEVQTENGPSFDLISYKITNSKPWRKTAWRYVTSPEGRDTTVFMSDDGEMSLLPTFYVSDIEEIYGDDSLSLMSCKGGKMVISPFTQENMEHKLVPVSGAV